jgi:hypothetical protein
MLFTELHPQLVAKAISLDSRRYTFPVKNHVAILSIRSTDMDADPGVLPEYGATIIKLDNSKHDEMCDRGPENIKQKIVELIIKFLSNN